MEIIKHELAPDLTIYQGNVLDTLRQLPDKSVQCVVTSPPYWGLRDYGTEPQVWGGTTDCDHKWGAPVRHAKANDVRGPGGIEKNTAANMNREALKEAGRYCDNCGAWLGHLGMEPTPEEFVAHMVEVFRESRRVLRDDGTLWMNMGDSYNGSGGAGGDYGPGGLKEGQPKYPGRKVASLKPKDLCGIPWRLAFALQADGWYLRSDIIWAKPNPMPESATDRPTKAHEYIFLLTKSQHYFYDADAIREPSTWDPSKTKKPDGWDTGKGSHGTIHRDGREKGQKNDASTSAAASGRNKRSVWTIATQPFPEAHFATFPEELPETCILAGTSPQACPICRAPWERQTEKRIVGPVWNQGGDRTGQHLDGDLEQGRGKFAKRYEVAVDTTGWQPTCACEHNDGSAKCIVLDTFWGSGTTGGVALRLGRTAWGCELSPEYVQLSIRARLANAQTSFLGQL